MLHQYRMAMALELARQAAELGEVPVGAVIAHRGRIIGAAHNQREQLHDPTAHAEMIAITQAAEALRSWRLDDCTLYVTLEPCPMCAGAIVQARVPMVVYGTPDPKGGAVHSLFRLLSDARLNHRCEIVAGIMQQESAQVLRDFFNDRRRQARTENRRLPERSMEDRMEGGMNRLDGDGDWGERLR